MRIKWVKKYIVELLIITVVVIFSHCREVTINSVNNYYEVLSSIQDFLIFLSGIILTLFGLTSFLPSNRFIKSLKQLNVDLLIIKRLFSLSVWSVVTSFLPSIMFLFDKNDKSDFGQIILIGFTSIFLLYFLFIVKLVIQFKVILDKVIDSETEQRKKG
ncbi:hypothetical protein [Streptococcus sp. E17BB]|uniref:hypothetical protein n=1 Tax=Streptococcus sp. E17BB TaxID=3278714 RepID=UPI00359E324C